MELETENKILKNKVFENSSIWFEKTREKHLEK